MRWLILIGWLLFVWCPLAWAQENMESFQFFADCQPMGVSVTVRNTPNGERLEEQEVALHAALESRLRSAHLYREQAGNHLEVFVYRFYDNGVDGTGVSAATTVFSKALHDPFTDQWGRGATVRLMMSHSNSSSYAQISQATDQFIADYLRVNKSACKTLN